MIQTLKFCNPSDANKINDISKELKKKERMKAHVMPTKHEVGLLATKDGDLAVIV